MAQGGAPRPAGGPAAPRMLPGPGGGPGPQPSSRRAGTFETEGGAEFPARAKCQGTLRPHFRLDEPCLARVRVPVA
eukprot:6593881-Alexandrium_andersonii.AAC.1